MYSNSSDTKKHRPKTLMSFCSTTTKDGLCGLAFWFMHSTVRYVPNEKRPHWKFERKNSKLCAIWQIFLAETNWFPKLGNKPPLILYTSWIPVLRTGHSKKCNFELFILGSWFIFSLKLLNMMNNNLKRLQFRKSFDNSLKHNIFPVGV